MEEKHDLGYSCHLSKLSSSLLSLTEVYEVVAAEQLWSVPTVSPVRSLLPHIWSNCPGLLQGACLWPLRPVAIHRAELRGQVRLPRRYLPITFVIPLQDRDLPLIVVEAEVCVSD